MASRANPVVPSEIFKEISVEEQSCANAIKAKNFNIKICFYSTLVFGAILSFGTIAIARTKPFNRMRVVQVSAFFSIVGSIVGFCARQFKHLKEKLLKDIEENYGKDIPSKGLTVEQEKLIPWRNYYQNKFEQYSRGSPDKPQERLCNNGYANTGLSSPGDQEASNLTFIALPQEGPIVQHKLRVRAMICKVQAAYIQVIINHFPTLPAEVQQDPETFKAAIFTFVTTPLSPSLEGQNLVQDNQDLVQFGPFDKRSLTTIEELRMDQIAATIEENVQNLVHFTNTTA